MGWNLWSQTVSGPVGEWVVCLGCLAPLNPPPEFPSGPIEPLLDEMRKVEDDLWVGAASWNGEPVIRVVTRKHLFHRDVMALRLWGFEDLLFPGLQEQRRKTPLERAFDQLGHPGGEVGEVWREFRSRSLAATVEFFRGTSIEKSEEKVFYRAAENELNRLGSLLDGGDLETIIDAVTRLARRQDRELGDYYRWASHDGSRPTDPDYYRLKGEGAVFRPFLEAAHQHRRTHPMRLER